MSPSPNATAAGGVDVSDLGCMAAVTESCCGYYPRFNWVLATCHANLSRRDSMACVPAKNTPNLRRASAMSLNYLAAYQWDGTQWRLDTTASLLPKADGRPIDIAPQYNIGQGLNQDWDLKYGPTTNATGTQGLGPGGLMVIVSARAFSWSSLYVLNQITINRGPGGKIMHDNCWTSSSGEFDAFEPPFWGGDDDLPIDRLYSTLNADSGRCLPAAPSVTRAFFQNCSHPLCCEMCECTDNMICFGHPAHIGTSPMGCISESRASDIPAGSTLFSVLGSNTLCSRFQAGVTGGAFSTAFFRHAHAGATDAAKMGRTHHIPPTNPRDDDVLGAHPGKGKAESHRSRRQRGPPRRTSEHAAAAAEPSPVMLIVVVDATGMWTYRWPLNLTAQTWPELRHTQPPATLQRRRPVSTQVRFAPPCDDSSQACAIFEPSCGGACPLVAAAGTFGVYQRSGPYAAEAARDGLNWWDAFDDTGQHEGAFFAARGPEIMPQVNTKIPPSPHGKHCANNCSSAVCQLPQRCNDAAPYMCTAGNPSVVNACSGDIYYWNTIKACSACCDTRSCDFTCSDACPASFCAANPSCLYECTSGDAAGGCSNSPRYWGEQGDCSSCCTCAP